jgi:hypothetical protein
MEDETLLQISDGLVELTKQIEDFNVLHLDKILISLSEINRHLKKISDSLELIANN